MNPESVILLLLQCLATLILHVFLPNSPRQVSCGRGQDQLATGDLPPGVPVAVSRVGKWGEMTTGKSARAPPRDGLHCNYHSR